MMVSITIGLLLLAALTSLFLNQQRSRSELDKANKMIDNGRYSLDMLSDNLRLAGFYGSLDLTDPTLLPVPVALPDPCETTPSLIRDVMRLHVQGYNATDATSTIAGVPSCVPSTIKTGSDILVLRRASTDTVIPTAVQAGTIYLQVPMCRYELSSSVILAQAPATYNLSKKNCTAANSGPFADLRRFRVQIYYVDSNNEAGDGIPTLKMAELNEAGAFSIVPLVEGIEFFQIDYGIDTTTPIKDGVADIYSTCSVCDTEAWSNVVSVNINILARNAEASTGYTDTKTYNLGMAGAFGPFNDRYKRHAYTQVIRLTNPAGRKEI